MYGPVPWLLYKETELEAARHFRIEGHTYFPIGELSLIIDDGNSGLTRVTPSPHVMIPVLRRNVKSEARHEVLVRT